MAPQDAAASAEEAAERRQRIEESRIEVMRRYAENRDCRRRVLLGYFGENLPGPCGHCDTCRAGTADDAEVDESSAPFPAGAVVDHVEWGRGSVVDVEDDRLTESSATRVTRCWRLNSYRRTDCCASPADTGGENGIRRISIGLRLDRDDIPAFTLVGPLGNPHRLGLVHGARAPSCERHP